MIRDARQGFEFSQLNSLLSWFLSQQDKKIKLMGLSMDLGHLNNMKIILTLWTLNSGDRVPLFVLILCILLTIEPTNFKKSYFRISKKYDQTSINLNNILFNFRGYFSNYVGFDEIKCLCTFTKHTAQKFIAKAQCTLESQY